MEMCNLSLEQVERYELDLVAMLKQSFEKSFPGETYEEAVFPTRVESLKAYIKEGKACIFGVTIRNRLVGFIWFFEKDNAQYRTVHINHFVVHEDYRNRGIGKMLLDKVEGYAEQQGIKQIELLVTKDNQNAVNFYDKRGFEVERLVMKKKVLK